MMTTFTLTGIYEGHQVEVTWTDGRLSGDTPAVGAVVSMAASLEGNPIITPASVIEHDHLTDPYAAYQIITMVLGADAQFITGSVPPTESSQ
jgi:hypothetical protein